jgi:parallel beta-helix repeat protein
MKEKEMGRVIGILIVGLMLGLLFGMTLSSATVNAISDRNGITHTNVNVSRTTSTINSLNLQTIQQNEFPTIKSEKSDLNSVIHTRNNDIYSVIARNNDQFDSNMLMLDDGKIPVIIQLEEAPILEYKTESSLFYSKTVDISANEEIESAVISYANTVEYTHRLVKSDIKRADINITLKSEFKNVFNGFSADIFRSDVEKIKDIPHVKTVYPDNEVSIALQDSVFLMNATEVWQMKDSNNKFVTGENITVAIIDTGIDYIHPDLGGGFGPGYKVIGGYDICNNDADPMDDHGHGTHCAGIVAANGTLKGVAPSAKLMAYKVLSSGGSGASSDVIAGIEMAIDPDGNPTTDDGADVISMSLGGWGDPDDPTAQAVDTATDAGIIVVVAAGNSGPYKETIDSPGCARKAITVGASDKSDVIAGFSSRGPVIWNDEVLIKPDVLAPGVSIYSTYLSGGYASFSGTSMATPHVAGAAALLLQGHPDWSPEEVKSALSSTAIDLNYSVYDQGSGRIDVLDAYLTNITTVNSSICFGRIMDDTSELLYVKNVGNSSITVDITAHTVLGAYPNLTDYQNPQEFDYVETNVSNIVLSPNNASVVNVSLNIPNDAIEGYYQGTLTLSYNDFNLTVPFSFTLLSQLNVYTIDENGELLHPFDVYVYQKPEVKFTGREQIQWSNKDYATFNLPSGTYNVHAAELFIYSGWYERDSSYILSKNITVPKLSTVNVYLNISDAHEFTLSAKTFSNKTIMLRQAKWVISYKGTDQMAYAWQNGGFGQLSKGDEIFNLPNNFTFYISDTDANITLTYQGYSYSPAYWRFMELNWQHWYGGAYPEPNFYISADADEMYLLSWELHGVNSTTETSLDIPKNVSNYNVIYDLPGVNLRPYIGYDHLSSGGDAVFYMPASFGSGIEPVYAGLHRTFYVNAPYAYKYASGYWNDVPEFVMSFYEADWKHSKSGYYYGTIGPDERFLKFKPLQQKNISLGAGPFFPPVIFNNSDTSIKIYHPMLSDISGNAVIGNNYPYLCVKRDGSYVYSGTPVEWWGLPFRMRMINISESGDYTVEYTQDTGSDISKEITIKAGFTIPRADMNPPRIIGLDMPQGFEEGDPIPITLRVEDESNISNALIKYSTDNGTSWMPLAVNRTDNDFTSQINDTMGINRISLWLTTTDSFGNYLEYTTIPASIRKTPVNLSINLNITEIPFTSDPFTIHITGSLLNNGNPLSKAAFPIAFSVNDVQIGYIRDLKYINTTGTYEHGTVDFNWTFIPSDFAQIPGNKLILDFDFDVGTYKSVSETITVPVIFSSVHNLNTSLNYSTIQEAIDAPETLAGHTILVDAGTYYENVVVDKRLTLIGEGADVVTLTALDPSDYVFLVLGTSYVNISGFTITGATEWWAGIRLNGGYHCNISDNNITGNRYGLSIYGRYNIITNNIISNNEIRGIGLYLLDDNIIYNNYFSNNTNNAYDTGNSTWNIAKTAGTNIIGGDYLGGNYWDDYVGADSDGDGLGDTLIAYNASGNITNGGDYLPLVSVGVAPPSITSRSPPSPVTDTDGAARTFNITIDQNVNVGWQINGTEVQLNESVKEAFYTNMSAAIGTWNVSAIASNANAALFKTKQG